MVTEREMKEALAKLDFKLKKKKYNLDIKQIKANIIEGHFRLTDDPERISEMYRNKCFREIFFFYGKVIAALVPALSVITSIFSLLIIIYS